MEYVYMQKPCPQDAKGVTVHLTAYDPNGNFQDIGTTTTDLNGHFGKSWVPPVPGEYYVQATFEGSESYWPSYDSSYFVVDPSPSAGMLIEPEQLGPTTVGSTAPTGVTELPSVSSEVSIIAAVAVAVVIGVAAFWTLRKRK